MQGGQYITLGLAGCTFCVDSLKTYTCPVRYIFPVSLSPPQLLLPDNATYNVFGRVLSLLGLTYFRLWLLTHLAAISTSCFYRVFCLQVHLVAQRFT
jgi:hypothetical protein